MATHTPHTYSYSFNGAKCALCGQHTHHIFTATNNATGQIDTLDTACHTATTTPTGLQGHNLVGGWIDEFAAWTQPEKEAS